jgi:hypothetical protein
MAQATDEKGSFGTTTRAPFREHLTPDVKHNIVIIDYKVNYDQVFFWLLKQEPRSRAERAAVKETFIPRIRESKQ